VGGTGEMLITVERIESLVCCQHRYSPVLLLCYLSLFKSQLVEKLLMAVNQPKFWQKYAFAH